MFTSRLTCLFSKKIILIILSLSTALCMRAQKYYVSSSLGNDLNNGLSIQTPFKSIEKLNSINFNAGDSIFFKSGDYWEGMFWLKGSGTLTEPIVVDVYGGNTKPIINGFGYQASVLIFNDGFLRPFPMTEPRKPFLRTPTWSIEIPPISISALK